MFYSDEDIKKSIKSVPSIEKLYGKSILITGATGMICSTVADVFFWLNDNCNAGIKIVIAGRSKDRVTKRFSNYVEGKDYSFIQYDATSEEKIDASVDYIIHGASNANPAVYVKEPVETMLANIVGLKILLDLVKDNKAKRLLYVSSSEVYGRKENSEPYREEDYGFVDILNPRACYPNSKRTAETLCVAYGDEYDVDTVMVRPGHIYGPTITPSDNRASAQFTRNAVNGENIVMKSAGTQMRSYCHTLDCATAIITVLLEGERGHAYNISNSAAIVSIRQVAEALAKETNTKVVFETPTNAESKGYNLMDNSSLDASRLESLGWKAEYSLEDGVRQMVRALKEN